MTRIYELIEKDHALHRALLERISETQGDIATRQTLWERFYYDVKAHAAAEEETFYSRLIADPDGQDDARHSVAEHQELDDIIEELNAMDMSNTGWLNRFATLRHDYEHHIDEEENEIFAKARSVFSDTDALSFGKAFTKRKAAEIHLVDQKAEASLED